jgi:hypothetical protein
MTDYSESKAKAIEADLLNLAKRIHRGRQAMVSPADAETCERAAVLIAQYRTRLAAEIVTDMDAWFGSTDAA